MRDRVPIVVVQGSLAPWVDKDVQPILADGTPYEISKIHLVTDADPGGTEITVEFRNEPDGAGDVLTVTIAAGESVGEASGALQLDGTQDLHQRVTVAGGSFGLSGWFIIDAAVAPSSGTALTTLARVKLEEGITGSGHDTLLQLLIDGVTEEFQRQTARKLVSLAISDEKHDGPGWRDILYANEYPVASAGLTVTEDDVSLVDGTDFDLVNAVGGLYRTSGGDSISWAKGRRNVALTYTGGFETIPADLVTAATAQVRDWYHRTQPGGQRLGISSSSREAGGTTVYQDLLPPVQAILKSYARRS